MKKTSIAIRIRYAETDQMGFVHHGNYAQFFEIGRLDWIKKNHLSYKEIESNGIILPVTYFESSYIKSAYYDDKLTIETFLIEIPLVRLKFGYNIFNENNELITKGKTHLAFVNKKTNKPIRCPEYFLDKL